MNALATIQQECQGIDDTLTQEQVLAIYDRILFFSRELKVMKESAETAMLEWIKTHGDLIVSDTVRYYAGTDKTTKCVNVPAAVEALLVATGGDFNAMCEFLSSQPIKHGAAKKTLTPEQYAELFRVEVKTTLEEGKPSKKLMKADEAFGGARKPYAPRPKLAGVAGASVGGSPPAPAPAPSQPAGTGSAGTGTVAQGDENPAKGGDRALTRTSEPLPTAPTKPLPAAPTAATHAAAGSPPTATGAATGRPAAKRVREVLNAPEPDPTLQAQSDTAEATLDAQAEDEANRATPEDKAEMFSLGDIKHLRGWLKAQKNIGGRMQKFATEECQRFGVAMVDESTDEQVRDVCRAVRLKQLKG